jgi:hypothetical protein
MTSVLIDENMKLRSTLGALSTLFADPTQGSRLPEVGIDIHRLKEAVERNDKNYLLEVGEVLRDKIGMHTREAHATKNVNQARDKQSDEVVVKAPTPNPALNERIAAKASGIDREAVEAPIFGNLTARAENELFDKIRLSGQNFESGGLGMLTTSGSPPKGAGQTVPKHLHLSIRLKWRSFSRLLRLRTKETKAAAIQPILRAMEHKALAQAHQWISMSIFTPIFSLAVEVVISTIWTSINSYFLMGQVHLVFKCQILRI